MKRFEMNERESTELIKMEVEGSGEWIWDFIIARFPAGLLY